MVYYMNNDKRRILPGKKMQYTSIQTEMFESYEEFSKIYDWCESNFGKYNQNWSIVWSNKTIEWNFSNRENQARFVLVWL